VQKHQFIFTILTLLLVGQPCILASTKPLPEEKPMGQSKITFYIPPATPSDFEVITPEVSGDLKIHFNGTNPLEDALQEVYASNQQEIKQLCYKNFKFHEFRARVQSADLKQKATEEIEKNCEELFKFLTERFLVRRGHDVLQTMTQQDLAMWIAEFSLRMLKEKPLRPFVYPTAEQQKEAIIQTPSFVILYPEEDK